MKITTKLRLIGAVILFFNLWVVGRYSIEGIPVLFLTFGFAVGFEYFVVRKWPEHESKPETKID
ncbi:MAG: hypothetical protein Q8L80_06855 [Gallionella sp.]|nr:hypothetical protein [Gallionella sp.]